MAGSGTPRPSRPSLLAPPRARGGSTEKPRSATSASRPGRACPGRPLGSPRSPVLVLRQLAQVEAGWLAGCPSSRATSAARIGPGRAELVEDPVADRVGDRAQHARVAHCGWGRRPCTAPYQNCARTIAQHYLRNIWCGYDRLPTARPQPRLHRALDRRHRQRARQPRCRMFVFPLHRLRTSPARRSPPPWSRPPTCGGMVRHAAAGRRARRPRRPQADHARLPAPPAALRYASLAVAGADRQPDAAPPRRWSRCSPGVAPGVFSPAQISAIRVGRRHRRPADRPQPEPGTPARRLAARRPARWCLGTPCGRWAPFAVDTISYCCRWPSPLSRIRTDLSAPSRARVLRPAP